MGNGYCVPLLPSVTRGYGYDWQGNQTSEQYSTPAGAVGLTYGVNLAGQLISVAGGQDSAVSSSLYAATAASMSPFGPTGASYGNGIAAVMGYDVFGHPTGMGLTQSSTPLYAWTATWSGQRVSSSGDTVNGGSATYTYDDMNRLSAATMGSLNLSWSYDRYGNRWSQSATGTWPGTVTQPSLSFSNTTNRVTTAGYAYDAAGNLTQDPSHTYTYDAEGNLTAIDYGATATYQYDALNRRVQAVTPSGTQEFDFNAAGQRATVWDGSGNLVSAQYYAAGQPFAYYLAADGHVRFRHQDWIGTERFRTTYTGSVEGTFLSLPYGDGLQTTTGSDTDASHYTGLDQDATNLEHAAYRELASGQGSWSSPDPYDGSYDFSDPQSMNRYAYVGNSPVVYSDPSGLVVPSQVSLLTQALEARLGGAQALAQNSDNEFADLAYVLGSGYWTQQQVFVVNSDDPSQNGTQTVPVWVPVLIPLPGIGPIFQVAQNNNPQDPKKPAPNNQPCNPATSHCNNSQQSQPPCTSTMCHRDPPRSPNTVPAMPPCTAAGIMGFGSAVTFGPWAAPEGAWLGYILGLGTGGYGVAKCL